MAVRQNFTIYGPLNQSGMRQSFARGPINENSTVQAYYLGSDITLGGWTASGGGSLFDMVNETVPDDSDYAASAVGQTNDTMEMKFAGVLTPSDSTQHTVSYRIKGENATNLTVALYCGTTLIQEWQHTPAPASWTTYAQAVDVANVANITNYGDLRLRVIAG